MIRANCHPPPTRYDIARSPPQPPDKDTFPNEFRVPHTNSITCLAGRPHTVAATETVLVLAGVFLFLLHGRRRWILPDRAELLERGLHGSQRVGRRARRHELLRGERVGHGGEMHDVRIAVAAVRVARFPGLALVQIQARCGQDVLQTGHRAGAGRFAQGRLAGGLAESGAEENRVVFLSANRF